MTQLSLKQAQKVEKILESINDQNAKNLPQKLLDFLPRIAQVIDQASRRILQKEKVPASEKIVSIFEAHTDIICRGKPNQTVEFGHKVWLNEVDGGIISKRTSLKRESS